MGGCGDADPVRGSGIGLFATDSFRPRKRGRLILIGRLGGYVSQSISGADYTTALRIRDILQKKMTELFDSYDVLATASLPVAATPLSSASGYGIIPFLIRWAGLAIFAVCRPFRCLAVSRIRICRLVCSLWDGRGMTRRFCRLEEFFSRPRTGIRNIRSCSSGLPGLRIFIFAE